MRSIRAAAVAMVLTSTLIVAPSALAKSDETFDGETGDASVGVEGIGRQTVSVSDTPGTVSETTRTNIEQTYEDADIICALRQGADEDGDLLNEDGGDLCEDLDDAPTVAEIAAMITTEFQSLHLTPPPISYQPEGDWALVNMDFIVFTDAGAQEMDTTILGAPVTIRATPVSYSWDFGDGSGPLVTSDQGSPYPNQTLAHVYSSASDGVVVTLTTSWQGEFRIGAGAWLPISGFATTSSSTGPIEIVEMDVNLVPNSDD